MSTARKRSLSPRETDTLGARAPCRTRDDRHSEGVASSRISRSGGSPAPVCPGHFTLCAKGSSCASQYVCDEFPLANLCDSCAGPPFETEQVRAFEKLFAQFRELQRKSPIVIRPTLFESKIHSIVDDTLTSGCCKRCFTAELNVDFLATTTKHRITSPKQDLLLSYESGAPIKGRHSMRVMSIGSCCANYFSESRSCEQCRPLPLWQAHGVAVERLLTMYQYFQYQLPFAILATSFNQTVIDVQPGTPQSPHGCHWENLTAVLDVEYEVLPYVVHPDVLPLEVTQLVWSYLMRPDVAKEWGE